MSLAPTDLLGKIFWGLCAAALLLSFALPLQYLPDIKLCWFYEYTHIPCPACGLTRAFLCISHGDWSRAWDLNPFGFVFYPLAVYGSLRPFLLKRATRFSSPLEKLFTADLFFPALLGLMFVVWFLRLKSGTLTD